MLQVTHLRKTFAPERRLGRRQAGSGPVNAIDDVTFKVNEGELFTLLGPSGCGKTTTLRSIAGLETPDSGEITLGDRVLFSGDGERTLKVPINERGLGMVFQSYAIWPHLSVFDNVAFPMQVVRGSAKPSRAAIRDRVTEVLETMELGHLASRPATKLSGGQQQRLALARAIVTQPSLLLLDEPLSNLDAKLRESMRLELKRMQRDIGITSIYVTHDQVEALALSSVIAVMRDGKIVQMGSPREIYSRPNSQFVADFIGSSNFLEAEVVAAKGSTVTVKSQLGVVEVESAQQVSVTDTVLLAVRPEALTLGLREHHATGAELVPVRILTRAFLGEAIDFVVDVKGTELRAKGNPGIRLQGVEDAFLSVDPSQVAVVKLG